MATSIVFLDSRSGYSHAILDKQRDKIIDDTQFILYMYNRDK